MPPETSWAPLEDSMTEHRRLFPECLWCADEDKARDESGGLLTAEEFQKVVEEVKDNTNEPKKSPIKGFWAGKDLVEIVTGHDPIDGELALSSSLQEVVEDWDYELPKGIKRKKAFDHLAKAIAWARLGGIDKP